MKVEFSCSMSINDFHPGLTYTDGARCYLCVEDGHGNIMLTTLRDGFCFPAVNKLNVYPIKLKVVEDK